MRQEKGTFTCACIRATKGPPPGNSAKVYRQLRESIPKCAPQPHTDAALEAESHATMLQSITRFRHGCYVSPNHESLYHLVVCLPLRAMKIATATTKSKKTTAGQFSISSRSEMTSPVGNTPRYLYAITEAKREGTQSNLGQMMPVHNTAEA